MTKAVCFKCGEIKHGAFTLCKACQTRPMGEDHLVISLGITNHYLTREQLNQVSEKIKKGEAVKFQIDQTEILTQEVKKFLLTPVGRMLSGQSMGLPKKKWWQFWV